MIANNPGGLSGNTRQNIAPDNASPTTGTRFDKEFFKGLARQKRRSKGWGRDKIWNYLRHEFGDAFYYSARTIGDWIKGVPKGPTSRSAPFDRSEFESADLPYLMRLDLLNQKMFWGNKLSVAEAETAVKLNHCFESSDGEPVDLFAQLAVIDTYTMMSEEGMSVDALDDFLAFQPWKPGGSDSYLFGLQNQSIKFPTIIRLLGKIPDLPLESDSQDSIFSVPKYIAGAHAQLGIPAITYFYRNERQDGVVHIDITSYIEVLAEECNWRGLMLAGRDGSLESAPTFSPAQKDFEYDTVMAVFDPTDYTKQHRKYL